MHVFLFESGLLSILAYVMIAVKLWAIVDAVVRPAEAYPAADKLTKQAWLLILGLVLVTGILFAGPASLFALVGIIVALVYLLDVRPALAGVVRPRR